MSSYQAKHPAAFINQVAEGRHFSEAIEWLQRTWDDYIDADTKRKDAEAKLREAQEDAERYQWLREQHKQGAPKSHFVMLAGQLVDWHFPSPETVDAAIDAAREGK